MTLDAGPMCPYCFKRGVHAATCTNPFQPKDKP